jgi:hypothetical protein
MNLIRLAALGTLALTLCSHAQTPSPAKMSPADEYAAKQKAVDENNNRLRKVNELLVQARTAKAKDDFDTDSSLMQQAVAIKSDEPLLWLMLGDAQVGQKKFQEAAKSYNKVIEITEATKKQLNLNTQARSDLAQLSGKSDAPSTAAPIAQSASTAPATTPMAQAMAPVECPTSTSPASGPTLCETISFINKMFQEQGAFPFTMRRKVEPRNPNSDWATDKTHFTVQALVLETPCKAILGAAAGDGGYILSSSQNLGDIDPLTIKVASFSDFLETGDSDTFAIRTDPDLYMVTFGTLQEKSTDLGVFAEKATADRVAKAYIHAIVLCGAKADPF